MALNDERCPNQRDSFYEEVAAGVDGYCDCDTSWSPTNHEFVPDPSGDPDFVDECFANGRFEHELHSGVSVLRTCGYSPEDH